MDHLWIINGSYGGCADKIVGIGEIFRKEKMTNEGGNKIRRIKTTNILEILIYWM